MSETVFILLILSFVAAIGWAVGNIKFKGVSLGVSGVLFIGLIFGHFLSNNFMQLDASTLEFIRDFGLVLFVYSIGMQMGRGFWKSLLAHGKLLNSLSIMVTVLGSVITISLYKILDIPLAAIIGIYAGAITNTASLGAAQQFLETYLGSGAGEAALGYAVAYPFSIIGLILGIVFIKIIFKVPIKEEVIAYEKSQRTGEDIIETELKVTNPYCQGLAMNAIPGMFKAGVVPTLLRRKKKSMVPNLKTIVENKDILHLVGPKSLVEQMAIVLGSPKDENILPSRRRNKNVQTEKLFITNPKLIGKTINEILGKKDDEAVIISKVKRAGQELPAFPDMKLCFGDILTVTGTPPNLLKIVKLIGNDSLAMDKIRLVPIFLGIALGLLFGSVPFTIPGLSYPVQFGLAGGPLLIAIYFAGVGRMGSIVWYLPPAASRFMSELGITLFLAVVGIIAGTKFLPTILSESGLEWIGIGLTITLVPILIMAFLARICFKMNFLTLSGTMCAAMTNPIAMTFASSISSSDGPVSAYITAYPLTVLLRIVSIQIIILLLL